MYLIKHSYCEKGENIDIFWWILGATIIDGLIAFVGIFTLWMSKRTFNKIIGILVAFATGALLAGALYHMLAESLEKLPKNVAFSWLIVGFGLFFILERVLKWHHCHKRKCKIHPFSYLILVGDGFHNIIDGLVIGASFIISIPFGIVTTLLIIGHEIPQELGDFAVLVYGGIPKIKALIYSFIAQLTCVIGGVVAYLAAGIPNTTSLLLAFGAGNFLYISASDLIPELHKEPDTKKAIYAFMYFIVGVLFMLGIKALFKA